MEINKFSYLSIYSRAGRSLAVKGSGVVAILRKLRIYSNPPPPHPQIHPSFLEMIPPHCLLPSINAAAPPPLPSPAYSGYKSCWRSLRTLSYSRLYEIGVYNLRLLRSISMHARYTLHKYTFMKLLK